MASAPNSSSPTGWRAPIGAANSLRQSSPRYGLELELGLPVGRIELSATSAASAACPRTSRRPPRSATATMKTTRSPVEVGELDPGDEYCARARRLQRLRERHQHEGRVHARRPAHQRHGIRGRRQHAAGGSRSGRRGDRIPRSCTPDRLRMVLAARARGAAGRARARRPRSASPTTPSTRSRCSSTGLVGGSNTAPPCRRQTNRARRWASRSPSPSARPSSR